MQLFDNQVGVIATPVVDVVETTRIGLEGLGIRELLAGYTVRIEVIIKMDSIHIVALHNVGHYVV